MIRYATPVFDAADQRRGIVVINVYAEHFLSQLRTSRGGLIMANQDGFYLAHPDETRLWGGPNDLNTGQGIWRDYAEDAPAILTGTEGDITTRSRVVVYTTLYPVANDRTHFLGPFFLRLWLFGISQGN